VIAELSRLRSGASAIGLTLSDDALARFERYLAELLYWRRRINLTAAATAQEIVALHLLDSLWPLVVWEFPDQARIIDVGAGAGFPGIPMKIARPDVWLTLVEASRRRVAFLERVRDRLEMPGVEVVWGRAERLAHAPALRETFDGAVERATAPTSAAVELCLPFVKPGGAAVLLKGPRARDEVVDARPLAHAMGGGAVRVEPRVSPTAERMTVIVVLEKAHPTPRLYPRGPVRLGRLPPDPPPHSPAPR
jgi:16S rRNA (guanine527-N7)-methyltransferase